VAICGHPGSGKSEIQRILHERFDITPFDDGAILRRHCMELFDMELSDVITQDGKRRFTEIGNVSWQNRKILGEYGNALETTFGSTVIAGYALRQALLDWQDRGYTGTGYSFGSVRRDQGRVYAQAGGIVLEVRRPGVAPTGNIWDEHDQALVTHTFVNHMETVEQLEEDFAIFFQLVLNSVGSTEADRKIVNG
jgi:hypothetical protein